MKKNIKIFLLWLTIGLIVTSSCTQKKHDKLQIGYLPLAGSLPLLVATDEGFFKELGFDVEMNRFNSSNDIGNAATLGKIDVFIAATNVVFDIGFVSKKKHTLIIPNPYAKQPGHITDYILVKDTNSIKQLSDLKGKKIGIFPGSVVKVFCKLILQKYGLSQSDYVLIELLPKDWAVAMQTGQIDALSAVEPQASQIIQDKIGYPISSGFYAMLIPNVPLSSEWISENYVKEHGKEQANKIIAAIDKAVEYINNNPEKAKKYLIKYLNMREDVLKKVELNPWQKHSEISINEIQNFIDILYQNGAIQNKENINDYLLK